jgi:hypothetical protein
MSDDVLSSAANASPNPHRSTGNDNAAGDPGLSDEPRPSSGPSSGPSSAAPGMLSRRTRLELSILKATLRISKKRAASGIEVSSSGDVNALDANALEDAEPDASS